MEPDLTLIRRIARQEPPALAELYDKYGGAVFSLVSRIVRDPQEAEGVTQQVFLTVWRKADQYHPQRGQLSTWLFAMARNRAIDALRKMERNKESAGGDLGEIIDQSEGPLADCIHDERRQMVRKALEDIPREQRLAVYMSYYDGLSHREIAEALDQPLGTIKSRIQLGLGKLRQALEPYLSL